MPAFLKPSLQQKMAATAARLGDLNEWMSAPQLLRGQDRRFFGSGQTNVFRQSRTWVRRRGLGGI